MKVLITGATGFLGSHLTNALVDEGHDITILKRSFSNTWRISEREQKLNVFNIDKCSLSEPFQKHGPFDVIIHTATEYDRNGHAFSQLFESNMAFPLKLLETAIAYKTKLFINTDSFIHKNKQSYNDLAGYALTKQQFVQWLKVFSALERIKIINLKLEHVYGPFDNDNKFIPFIVRNCLNHTAELNLTLGNQKRDFIHVNDVVAAYSLLLKQAKNNEHSFSEYEIGTGTSVPIRQLVELIHKKTNSKTLLRFGALPYHKNEIMDSKANNLAIKKLGWDFFVQLDEGVKAMMVKELGR